MYKTGYESERSPQADRGLWPPYRAPRRPRRGREARRTAVRDRGSGQERRSRGQV